jgi:hypothetical protein
VPPSATRLPSTVVKERWPAIKQTPNGAEPAWSSSGVVGEDHFHHRRWRVPCPTATRSAPVRQGCLDSPVPVLGTLALT